MKHRRNINRSVWKLLACWLNSKWHYHGNRGIKIMGWSGVRYCFAMVILVLIIILPHIFVCSISRRCLDQTLRNPVGISYAMWSCAVFQNGCRCHGNGKNTKKLKSTKMIIAGYSPNRNWWILIGKHPLLVERDKPKNRNRLDKLCRSCHGNKKGGISKFFGFLSSNFMKLCRNIHRSVWQLLEGWKNSKWWPLPW